MNGTFEDSRQRYILKRVELTVAATAKARKRARHKIKTCVILRERNVKFTTPAVESFKRLGGNVVLE